MTEGIPFVDDHHGIDVLADYQKQCYSIMEYLQVFIWVVACAANGRSVEVARSVAIASCPVRALKKRNLLSLSGSVAGRCSVS